MVSELSSWEHLFNNFFEENGIFLGTLLKSGALLKSGTRDGPTPPPT